MTISSKDKQKLKALAHSIQPSVIIGKDGLSSGTLNSIENSFKHNELIKIKFNSFKTEKDTISQNIIDLNKAILIGKIGNIIILYKQNADPEKRKIKIWIVITSYNIAS